jgi:uncharacterized damage-inducible protein DinB
MNQVEEAIATWETFRKGTVDELANLPEEQWQWKPGEGARTVRELAIHIATSALGFADALLGDGQFMRLRDPQVQAEYAARFDSKTSKDDVIELVTSSGADTMQRLRAAASTLADQTMPSFGGERSRASGIWFAAAHEMYHRGQLATYARALSLVRAMTQRTQSATIPLGDDSRLTFTILPQQGSSTKAKGGTLPGR